MVHILYSPSDQNNRIWVSRDNLELGTESDYLGFSHDRLCLSRGEEAEENLFLDIFDSHLLLSFP